MSENHEAALESAKSLFQLGNLDEAGKLLLSVLATTPEHDAALALLAGVAHAKGQFQKAVTLMRQAASINPSVPGYHSNLGNLHKLLNNDGEALRCFDKVVALQPTNLQAVLQLADCCERTGKTQEAIDCYTKALSLNSGVAEIHCALACVYLKNKQFKMAVTAFKTACALRPEYGEANHGLGDALRITGYFSEAISYYERALSNHGSLDIASIYSNIGTCRQYLGDIEGAINAFEDAVCSSPGRYELYTNLLMALNYSSDRSPEEVFQAHKQFERGYVGEYAGGLSDFADKCESERALKIGYVSSNFCDHSVAHFIVPVLECHDRKNFEIYAYHNNTQNDSVTRRIREMTSNWKVVATLSDAELFEMICADGIDILVDLNGHTADNRLLVFARKPAPVQVSWIGYPNTTGLSAMDYRITDALVDPPGETDDLYTERLIRMPDIFSCYKPSAPCPELVAAPVLEKGYVTFGSFNNFAKITPQVLDLWCELLKKSESAHLLLKDKLFQSAEIRRKVTDIFQQTGIAGNRIELFSQDASKYEHLARYAQIDIALDPFPYNGTTTTCEALWMGVPVITLTGAAHAGRVGTSQMTSVGLGEFVAQSPERYLEIAAELSENWEYLQQIRSTMRERLIASPLLRADVFTRNLEVAYRDAWHEYCLRG